MIFVFSFLAGLAGASVIYKYGEILGLMDMPSHRSSHINSIPKGGGIGILTAFIFCSIYLNLDNSFWIPAMLLSLLSFAGDYNGIPPIVRLIFQFGCSFIVLQGHAPIFMILPLSIFIVGTANFYNFMDGIDGIAGITGFIGFLLLAIYSQLNGLETTYSLFSVGISLSCLGFLCLNFPKAKVFMGDISSILLGFIFACLVVFFSNSVTDFIVMIGFLLPFYFDEMFTLVFRIKSRDSILKPHRKHIYQILANEASIDHWKISLGYGFLQAIVGISVILLSESGLVYLLMAYAVYTIVFIFISNGIRRKYL